ncbi:DUF3368 domain-containing protein [Flavobacterium sp. RHBU_3]|uniref:DUF3368 domain-containing protein n=1 Tax=Flavobacterium sp. RHBU_3 TaxID=3391184 RepID=UPI003984A3F5
MLKTIISDTSCLIILSKINQLNLLHKLYGEITTTPEIAGEFGEPLPEWINIEEVTDKLRQQILELQIDKGESSAIALALQVPESTLILDDYKARKIATQLNLKITGTIGIIVKCKKVGIITTIKPILNDIKTTDFRLSNELEQLALKEAGEI